MEGYTDKKIITKQVIINYVEKDEAHLLPITADEKVVNEIQSALYDYERLQVQQEKKDKLLALYKKVDKFFNCLYHDTNYVELMLLYRQIRELEEESK